VTDDSYPDYPSHYRPRTRAGWIALVVFLALMSLAEPPIVTSWANRIEPWVFGMPFLYSYLLVVYVALICVLLWAQKRGL
jgi:choline-glycine betaine transporter